MKKLLSFALLLSCVASLSAQSFKFDYNNVPIENRDTLTVEMKTGFMVAIRSLHITNMTDADMNVVISALDVNPNSMRLLSICTGDQCRDSSVSAPFTIAAGQQYDELLIDFDIPTSLQPGDEGLFVVMISDSRSAYDTASNPYIFVKVVVTDDQGIESVSNSCTTSAFPNPAAETVAILYSLESNNHASLLIFNSLGSCVKAIPLSDDKGTLQVDVSDLPVGVYTYGIRNGNRLSSMQKLLVK